MSFPTAGVASEQRSRLLGGRGRGGGNRLKLSASAVPVSFRLLAIKLTDIFAACSARIPRRRRHLSVDIDFKSLEFRAGKVRG